MTILGRKYSNSWPCDKPVWTITALCLALAAILFAFYLQYRVFWTRLEQYYFDDYWVAYAYSATYRDKIYPRLLYVEDIRGRRKLATDADVVDGQTSTDDGPPVPLALSEEDQQRGWSLVLGPHQPYDVEAFKKLLIHRIYHDHTLEGIFTPDLIFGIFIFIGGLCFAIPLDRERARILKYGRHIRGAELVTAAEFNRLTEADGLAFPTLVPRTYFEWLLRRIGNVIRIPYEAEACHVIVIGDTGRGKSVVMKYSLRQVRDRGERAIVYDPDLEYVQEFYDPERGDMILNPLDERMPYWELEKEIRHETEALAVASSLFPDELRKQEFFTRSPREVMAHLLTYQPTAAELSAWLPKDEEIDKRVQDSEVSSLISKAAPQQREGVMSELKLSGKSIRVLHSDKEGTARFNTRDWAHNGKGWLFLTSTPETLERLLPLQCVWLDMLVMRLMNVGILSQNAPRTWFFLDEVASLRKLPKLHTAVTRNRKANCPVFLGFQGKSQLEAIYGQDAEAMLSQPATKIFLHTSEPRAAHWISEYIGEVEVEYLRRTRNPGRPVPGQPHAERETWSESVETRIEKLLLPSEIGGLPKLQGYLKYDNFVVPLHLPVLEAVRRQAGFLPRKQTFLQAANSKVTTVPRKAVQSENSDRTADLDDTRFFK